MNWIKTTRADREVVQIADRHYNRQKVGSPQFVPPGRCLVLKMVPVTAFWVTSWPYPQYVKHSWAGAWICSAFRNERSDIYLSSFLIREAIACTRSIFGEVPELGMVTFINEKKVRHKRDIGRCFRKAGFKHIGFTKKGLWVFQILSNEMPEPLPPL